MGVKRRWLLLTRLPFQAHLSIGVFDRVRGIATRKGIAGGRFVGQASERDCLIDIEVESEIGTMPISLTDSRSLVIAGSLGQVATFFIPWRRKSLIGSRGLEEAFRIILKPHVELEVFRIVRDVE